MLTSEVLSNLREYVKSVGGDFPSAINALVVFGSYARKNPKINSDLDIALLVGEGFGRSDRANVREILNGFYESIDINLFCTTAEKLESAESEFDANYWIKKEGELLWQR